jgi:hypothetical protein
MEKTAPASEMRQALKMDTIFYSLKYERLNTLGT